ncbi:ATP-binding protein [Granulicella sibirica]|uniref:histidine kinase n=1 Tax=Granulicella sibirica TaxID=2479048 RepID=A0A4Q0T7B2_9BACT|nr:ATP-binding protein [Granulicella sibirica]RXH57998.1 Sensor histidine kinase [Granulicella sibirica]
MRLSRPTHIRTRLALWYVAILALTLTVYIGIVFAFQYVLLEHQIFHDEIQDVETVEGLLYFDPSGALRVQESYHSHPQSRLLVDRMMEIRDLTGTVLYRSDTLHGVPLGGPAFAGEGAGTFNQRSTQLADGTSVLAISHLHPVEGRPVLIRLAYGLAPLQDRMLHFFLLLLLATPVGLLVAGFAGYSLARRALRPLELMAARAEQITASNLHDRIEIENPRDELGRMARVMNHLLERLEQAFAQLQRFTADAAHELRTPLASLRATGELALQGNTTLSEYRDSVGSILEETIRLNQTIEGLLLLSRAETTSDATLQTTFSLQEVVDEILLLLEVIIEERKLTIRKEHEVIAGLLTADRSLVRVALLNVLHNAVKFSPDGSTIRISYSSEQYERTPVLQVCIHDSGPGILRNEYDRVFERFFTSSSTGTISKSGAGLGLSIAKLIVARSGGRIFFDEQVTQGARCCVALPISTSQG